VLIAATEVVSLLVGRQNVDLQSLVNEVVRLAAFILLLLALVGLYARQVGYATSGVDPVTARDWSDDADRWQTERKRVIVSLAARFGPVP